jgi:integrase
MKLSDSAKSGYQVSLRQISKWAGDEVATSINRKMVQTLHDTVSQTRPASAKAMICALRLLFSWAEKHALAPPHSNPVIKIDSDYKAKKGVIWTPEQVAHFAATADGMGYFSIGTAVLINEWMGQRLGDVLAIRIGDYRNGLIYIKQSKTRAEVMIPVDDIPSVKKRIAEQISRNEAEGFRDGPLILRNIERISEGGGHYSKSFFSRYFSLARAECARAMPEMKDLIFKDLRHTAVTRMAEAGAEIPQIAAVTGHSFQTCQVLVDRYNIRTAKMARSAISRRLNAEGKQS